MSNIHNYPKKIMWWWSHLGHPSPSPEKKKSKFIQIVAAEIEQRRKFRVSRQSQGRPAITTTTFFFYLRVIAI